MMGLGWRGSAGPARGDGGVSQRSRPHPSPRIINPAGQGAGVRVGGPGHRVVAGPPRRTQPKSFFTQPSTTGVLRDRRPRLLAPTTSCADASRSRYTGPIQRADWRGASGSARRCGGCMGERLHTVGCSPGASRSGYRCITTAAAGTGRRSRRMASGAPSGSPWRYRTRRRSWCLPTGHCRP